MSSCGKGARALIFLVTIFQVLVFPVLAERPKATESMEECSSFAEAKKHIGQKSCIRGQVLRVEHSPEGMSYLNFCEDSRACPFSVVVFAEDLHHVGALDNPDWTNHRDPGKRKSKRLRRPRRNRCEGLRATRRRTEATPARAQGIRCGTAGQVLRRHLPCH
jgi:hypothetical protein